MPQDLALNLDLDITEPLVADIGRDVTEEDVKLLDTYGARGFKQAPLARIRSRHHSAARMIATGEDNATVAATLGMTAQNVSILLRDPSFKELVKFYEAELHEKFLSMNEELAGLGRDAILEIKARLEEAPEEITTKELVTILEKALDRSGHGPQSTNNVNVTVGLAERLGAARARRHMTLVEDAQLVEAKKESD